jgi:hypothetical protein
VNPADWLTTVPVGEPDEDGERAQVPVALTRMTPGQIDRWAAAVNNASPEQIAEAQIRSLQHLLDERERELAALREAAGALIDGLIKHLDAHDVAACEDWANPDTDCQGIATQYLASGSGDGDDLCDVCAAAREERGWVLKAERHYAPALRALRKLLGGAS